MKNVITKFRKRSHGSVVVNSRGFTIVEVMVAMAIFTVLVVIGIGAVLDSTKEHQNTRNIRTVMDNLNYVMQDMARNIRLGSEVRCVAPPQVPQLPFPQYLTDPNDPTSSIITASCPGGANMIIFKGVNGIRLSYIISPVPPFEILKQIGDDITQAQSITPPEVELDVFHSGFTVRGAEQRVDGDFSQPTVTIRLAGKVHYKDTDTPFAIQTTVTLRQLDQ